MPRWLRNFAYWHEAVLAVLLVGLLLWARKIEPEFVTWDSQLFLSTQVWELALMAIPMTLIIITAGIDLSVGSMMALSAVTLGLAFKYGWPGLVGMRPDDPHGLSIWLATALAIVVGTLAGAGNGLFIAKLRVHPLLVTLATLAAYRGIAQGVSLGEPVSGFPDAFSNIGQGDFHGIPYAAFLFIAGALLVAIVLIKMPLGRYLYAIGHNETAARFSGIPVDRIKIMLYTFAGATSGVAGVIFVSRRNTAKADVGMGIELDVITAVVLGGTSIFGGRGNMLGTVLGILLVHETREIVQARWGSEYVPIVIGLVLIGSVLLNRLLSIRRRGN